MLFLGTWTIHFYKSRDLEESFNILKENERHLDIHKYHNDPTSLIFVSKIYKDEHCIYLKITADRDRFFEHDANLIGNIIVRFLNVQMMRFNRKKINNYESASSNNVHMDFYKAEPYTTFDLV